MNSRDSVLLRKLRTARRQPAVMFMLVPVSWAMIGLATVAIRLLAFKRIAARLGPNLGAVTLAPPAQARTLARARLMGRSITIAANYAPFRSDCLPQALVAILFCRLTGTPYAAHLGVARDDDDSGSGIKAHAWVQSGSITMTGGPQSARHYKAVACFVSPDVAQAQRDLAT